MSPLIRIPMNFVGLFTVVTTVACTQPSTLNDNIEQGTTPEETPTTGVIETEEDTSVADTIDENVDGVDEDITTEDPPLEESHPSNKPCDLGPGIAGQDVVLEFPWDGETRTWILHLPTDYDCTPRPLLLGAHAYLSDGHSFQHDVAQIFDHINEHGHIAIFPDAMARSDSEADAGITSFNDGTSHFDSGPDGPTCTLSGHGIMAFSQIVVPREEVILPMGYQLCG